jgi:phage terminase large subunit-like protein
VRNKATSPDRMDALVWGIHELGFHIGVARFAPVSSPMPTTT